MEPPPDALERVDLRPAARFPSSIEIAGLVAGSVPFMITTATMSSASVNGQLTSFVYRDWLAIVCGGVAAACGALGAVKLRRTDRSKRVARVAAIVVLLGLGAVQLLRGVGWIGIGSPASHSSYTSVRVTETPARRPESRATIPAVDVEGPTRRLFAAWRDGRVRDIYDASHPELRKATTAAKLQDLRESFEDGFGAFEELAEPLTTTYESSIFVVKGRAIYAKGTLDFEVQFPLVDGKPRLGYLSLDIPKPLQVEPVNADADRVARRLLDGLFAGTLDRTLLELEARETVSAEFESELQSLLTELGKVKSISPPRVNDCRSRCLEFLVDGTKQRAIASVELSYKIRRWRVTRFNLKLDDAKPR